MIEHSQVEDGLHHANIEALICLKAKAFLEIKERIEKTLDLRALYGSNWLAYDDEV